MDFREVVTDHRTTHVNVAGPLDGSPLVLLHGAGATSTVWFANVAALAGRHRLYAVDLMGDAGRSIQSGRPLRKPADLLDWLLGVLEALDLSTTALLGHSYGAWLALTFVVRTPEHVTRVGLLDPTDCFIRLSTAYRAHAVPVLLRPSSGRMRRLLQWESNGAPLDADWLALVARSVGEVRRSRIVLPTKPSTEVLRTLTVPTLVVIAGRSRAHDPGRLATAVHRTMPTATIVTVSEATHHTLPFAPACEVNDALVKFFG